ncbi:uncharacterized protein GlcG (DUF336 family) [Pseudomonas sp. SLBN-26]|uniref:GlcG/HbpS family heme-binding protein n=1 Tax=Pseudomonadaceae TaxID=135621 RepID=UPI0011514F69|nr:MULTISPECIES: heme-binding protein [Pseudomonas]MCP1621071.1 uncharacterized protein GlcG (DUF336 family) [Pseudomonas otitidis]TQL10275.1 uncharacterized protein GlcG (DUF336 family) [Pseudomonas sp. SLBN-26]
MPAPLYQQTHLGLALAMRALHATLEAAEQHGVRVSIAVVDASGLPIHTAHMDGAPQPSRDIALHKAITAAGFGVATRTWDQRLAACSPGVRQGLPLQPNLALFGGGEPFLHDGRVIGAIGVSGASEAIDSACAQAASQSVARYLSNLDKNPGTEEQDAIPRSGS